MIPPTRWCFITRAIHASWMNQVEIWLSILVRKLLKRGNFRSAFRLARPNPGVHRLLQSDHGQTRQVDVHGTDLIMEPFLPQCTGQILFFLLLLNSFRSSEKIDHMRA